jgi:hypothetical protein
MADAPGAGDIDICFIETRCVLLVLYVRVSILLAHGNTCMTAYFHQEGRFGSVKLV